MSIVDQSNWEFEFSNTSQIDKAMGRFNPPTVLSFATSAELVGFMADDDKDNYTRLQRRIDDRIEADATAMTWKKQRTLLKDLKHFPLYRGKEFDRYHDAADARYRNQATQEQLTIADGLEAEIDASSVRVMPGQVLFHGRADRQLTDPARYPKFLSTSLNPVVARMSAFRRAGTKQVNGRPTVYVLTLGCSLPALWGQTGNSVEYELLLPPLLTSRLTDVYAGRNFDVVEAVIERRG